MIEHKSFKSRKTGHISVFLEILNLMLHFFSAVLQTFVHCPKIPGRVTHTCNAGTMISLMVSANNLCTEAAKEMTINLKLSQNVGRGVGLIHLLVGQVDPL